MNQFENRDVKFQEDIVSRKNENGSIILMKMDDSDVFFRVDGIAADIYKGIEGGKKLTEVYSDLCNRFPENKDQLASDIDSFLEKLDSLSLLCK
ncbi:PqqD family protein [Halobacteriovorax sp. HLS]|uniref:PqqD family protein n=1 Tax=Halobacteriovorax sp. HLS TaxID=2234000 RepID=UPI000FDB58B6|nr:PqqD family protein [Halobacteriovorax sp. HLS]